MEDTQRKAAWLPDVSRRGSKLDGVGHTPAAAASIVRDGSKAGAVLIEGLQPGEWSRERAEAIAAALRERAARLRAGDTSDVEDDLAAQLAFLSSLIGHAVRKGTAEGISPAAADVWMRMALKAQTAYARTVAAFAALNMVKPRTLNAD